MRKQLLFLFCGLTLFFSLTAAMCETEKPEPDPEPELKDYTCQCTYVATLSGPSAGEPNREETTTVKGETNFQGGMECSKLEGKYMAEHFQGTCLLQ